MFLFFFAVKFFVRLAQSNYCQRLKGTVLSAQATFFTAGPHLGGGGWVASHPLLEKENNNNNNNNNNK